MKRRHCPKKKDGTRRHQPLEYRWIQDRMMLMCPHCRAILCSNPPTIRPVAMA